jgi:hypothetical protein
MMRRMTPEVKAVVMTCRFNAGRLLPDKLEYGSIVASVLGGRYVVCSPGKHSRRQEFEGEQFYRLKPCKPGSVVGHGVYTRDELQGLRVRVCECG